jgi:hypothetical protein
LKLHISTLWIEQECSIHEEKSEDRGRLKINPEEVMMSAAFNRETGDETGGEFGTSTYLLNEGQAMASELMSGMEEMELGDPVEQYFACITTCSLDDGECITVCTEQLRASH